jgi:uncharacterized protein (DUF885 family)
LKQFFDLLWKTRMHVSPLYATYIGYAGVDDRLPDFSHETTDLLYRMTHIELAALNSIDRAHLTPGEQLSYDLLRRRIQFAIEGERFKPFDSLLVDHMGDSITEGVDVLTAMPAKTAGDYENMIKRMRAFPRMVDQGMALLEEGAKSGITPPRVTLTKVPDRVASNITDDPLKSPVLSPFVQMPETISAAERERLRKTASEVYAQQVKPALQKYHDYLAGPYMRRARETISVSALPDGNAFYAYELRASTTTNLTPDQIHELGLSEVKRIRAEMDEIIVKTGYKGTFHEFCNYLRTDPKFFYTNADDLVAGYRDIAKRIDPELMKLFAHLPRMPYGVKAMEHGAEMAPSALYNNGSIPAGRPGWDAHQYVRSESASEMGNGESRGARGSARPSPAIRPRRGTRRITRLASLGRLSRIFRRLGSLFRTHRRRPRPL